MYVRGYVRCFRCTTEQQRVEVILPVGVSRMLLPHMLQSSDLDRRKHWIRYTVVKAAVSGGLAKWNNADTIIKASIKRDANVFRAFIRSLTCTHRGVPATCAVCLFVRCTCEGCVRSWRDGFHAHEGCRESSSCHPTCTRWLCVPTRSSNRYVLSLKRFLRWVKG